MTRRLWTLALASPALLAAASVPTSAGSSAGQSELQRARAEVAAAESAMRRLEQAAEKARGETERLAAERRAAAAAIVASEARISVADAELQRTEAQVAALAATLDRQQAPLAALLAGIVTMGRRPPLLSSTDVNSLDEFVRIRALLDTTLPVIRERSAALSGELARSQALQAAAARGRRNLTLARKELQKRQQRFAVLEADAAKRAASLGANAVGASDVLIASREGVDQLRSESERRRAELRLAADLGSLAAAPARPGSAVTMSAPLPYRLPVDARVAEGVGSVSDTGIRARGLLLQSFAGQPVVVPADGTIAFAGAFRRHDGVVIIDHGQGWMTLMTGVRSNLKKGERVALGQPLGRALGPVSVELSENGAPVSAALIAGSSQSLFIKGKSG